MTPKAKHHKLIKKQMKHSSKNRITKPRTEKKGWVTQIKGLRGKFNTNPEIQSRKGINVTQNSQYMLVWDTSLITRASRVWWHYEKTGLRLRFQNAALGQKNAALGPFGLRPRFITRPKTCDYRPGRSKAALFKPRPKTRSYSRGKNAASDRPDLSTIWP